jgi:hypothetical protein
MHRLDAHRKAYSGMSEIILDPHKPMCCFFVCILFFRRNTFPRSLPIFWILLVASKNSNACANLTLWIDSYIRKHKNTDTFTALDACRLKQIHEQPSICVPRRVCIYILYIYTYTCSQHIYTCMSVRQCVYVCICTYGPKHQFLHVCV